MKVEEENKMKEKENSFVRRNGLNNKILESVEEEGKVERKEKENSLVRDRGLNNKFIKMAARRNDNRAESERKFRMQRQKEMEAKKMNMMDNGTDTIRNDAIGTTICYQGQRDMTQECYLPSGQFQEKSQSMETVSYEATV